MLFRLEFEVKYLNGQTSTVSTRPASDIAFERAYGVTVASLFTSMPAGMISDDQVVDKSAAMRWYGELKSEHSCFLAWHASRVAAPFDDWIETVDEVNWKFANQPDPTLPAPSANSSALSLP